MATMTFWDRLVYTDQDTIELMGMTFRRVGTSQRPPDDLRPDDVMELAPPVNEADAPLVRFAGAEPMEE